MRLRKGIYLECGDLFGCEAPADNVANCFVLWSGTIFTPHNLRSALFDDLILMPEFVFHFLEATGVHLTNGITLEIIIVDSVLEYKNRDCTAIKKKPT